MFSAAPYNIGLIIKEQGKGGNIEEEGRLWDMAEQVLGGGEHNSEGEAA